MVQDVEDVDPRLEREVLRHVKLTTHGHVPLKRTESAEGVPPKVALTARGDAERSRVDHSSSWCVRLIEIERYGGNDIRTLHAAGSRQCAAKGIFPRHHVQGRSAP